MRAEVMAAEHHASDLRHARDRAELELETALVRAEQLRQAEQEVAAELAQLADEAAALAGRLTAIGEERGAKAALARTPRSGVGAVEGRGAAAGGASAAGRGTVR